MCNSYTMGMSALPDIYTLARGLQALGQGPQASVYISGKAQMPMV